MYSFESPRDAILMSTHSIYFQDKIRKPLIMSPTIVGGMEGGGHTVFSADLVGVGVAPCLHSISLMNGWILA